MPQSSEFEALSEALLDCLYVLLSISKIERFTPTIIKYQGEKLVVPSNIIFMLKVAMYLSDFVSELYKILLSPARVLEEKIVVSNEVRGSIHVPLTVQLRGKGLPLVAYKHRRLSLNSPENILLKLFLRRLSDDVESVLNSIESIDLTGPDGRVIVLEGFLRRLKNQLEHIMKTLRKLRTLPLVREIHAGTLSFDDKTLLKYSHVVLRRGVRTYRRLATLVQRYVREKISIELARRDVKQYTHLATRIEPYKLYEVFTYYVTAVVLVEILYGSIITVLGDTIKIRTLDGTEYLIFYDKSIPERSWLHAGKVRFDKVERKKVPAGRPDVTLLLETKPLLVLDAKYTKSYEYLSQARYKILGYLNEYGTNVGAIVYDPDILAERPVDEEDLEFSGVLEEANKYDGAIIENANKCIYLLPLRPLAWEKLTRTRAYDLFVNMIKYSLEQSAGSAIAS